MGDSEKDFVLEIRMLALPAVLRALLERGHITRATLKRADGESIEDLLANVILGMSWADTPGTFEASEAIVDLATDASGSPVHGGSRIEFRRAVAKIYLEILQGRDDEE